jgi:hypothetical protein
MLSIKQNYTSQKIKTMKNILPILFFCFLALNINAQTLSYIGTPKGSAVTAYIVPEMSNADRAYWDSYFASPNRTQFVTSNGYSSSQTFNCHGYAWSIAEGGQTRWIGYYVQTDEDVYMTDGSYIQVCSETYPGKVSWGSGDHTAITTPTPGRFKSKWNKYPLMEHNWNDTPYGTANLKYYVATKISASNSFICGNTTYSVPYFAGGTYTWTKSSNISLNTTSGNSVVATANWNGPGWVEVVITSPCSSTSVTTRLNVSVGPTIGAVNIPQNTFYGGYANVYAEVPQVAGAGYYDYEWYLDGSFQQTSAYNHEFTFYGCGSHYVGVRAYTANCGWTDFSYAYFYVNCNGMFNIGIYPNPVNDYVTISLENTKAEKRAPSPASTSSATYEITFYDNQGQLRRSATLKEGPIQLSTANLPEGEYYIHVSQGKELFTKRIIIKH